MTSRKMSMLMLSLLISGCFEEKRLSIAEIGKVGSMGEKVVVHDLFIQTAEGGWRGFNYGAVSGYPGAGADIGGIGIPTYIKGSWSRGWNFDDDIEYYFIDAPINADLAEKKVMTLINYYQNYEDKYGMIQIIVEGPRVRIFRASVCYEKYDDCTPRENADPNGWVVKSPSGSDIVVLFDGTGLTSKTPFPKVSLTE